MIERDHRLHPGIENVPYDVVVVRQLGFVDLAGPWLDPCPFDTEPEHRDAELFRPRDVFGIPVPEVHGVPVRLLDRHGLRLLVAPPIAVRGRTLGLVTRHRDAPVERCWSRGGGRDAGNDDRTREKQDRDGSSYSAQHNDSFVGSARRWAEKVKVVYLSAQG